MFDSCFYCHSYRFMSSIICHLKLHKLIIHSVKNVCGRTCSKTQLSYVCACCRLRKGEILFFICLLTRPCSKYYLNSHPWGWDGVWRTITLAILETIFRARELTVEAACKNIHGINKFISQHDCSTINFLS